MYAIIQTAGHQVKVTPGGFATVAGTVAEPGAKVTLEQVLLVEKDGGEILAGEAERAIQQASRFIDFPERPKDQS